MPGLSLLRPPQRKGQVYRAQAQKENPLEPGDGAIQRQDEDQVAIDNHEEAFMAEDALTGSSSS
jgi:hypothetical protein